MLFYLMAIHFILKKWKQNPFASKMEIRVWSHWHAATEENSLPLSPTEVENMKQVLKEYGPVTYHELFGV
jgi:hypothetical protein